MSTKTPCIFKEIGLDAQNMLTLGSIHNKIRGDLYGCNEHKNIHFENE